MNFDDSSVSSEFADSISDLSSLSVVEESVEDLEDFTLLLVAHSFSEFLDGVNVSPSLEAVTNIGREVLEELKESLFFDGIVLVVSESEVAD